MPYTWDQIEFATFAVRVLGVIAVVALIAFAAKKRLVFWVGAAGAVLGWLLTDSLLPRAWSTGGALHNLELGAHSVLFNSIFSASVSLGVLALIQRLQHRHRFQFSLRAMLVFTTFVCVIAALIHIAAQ